MSRDIAKKIAALTAFLPGWLPLWETHKGRWRLVFLSPQLTQRYRDVQQPYISSGVWCEEPPYHFAEMLK